MAILPIFIPHAGCPHQCVFCNQKTISGQKSAAVVGAKAQIRRWLQWLKPSEDNEAAFYGGSFTGLDSFLQEQLLGLTDELVKQGSIGRVRLSTRPDYIDGEELKLLQQHHVKLVELGVQSLDDAVLQKAGHFSAAAADRCYWEKNHADHYANYLRVYDRCTRHRAAAFCGIYHSYRNNRTALHLPNSKVDN